MTEQIAKKRQLLVESSDFIYQGSIKQQLTEALQMSSGKHGTLLVKNIPVTLLNRKNKNGRIYTTQVMQKAINDARRLDLFKAKQMLSAGNEHPEASFVPPTEASHVVVDAYIKPHTKVVVEGKEETCDVLFMDWEILNTQNGKNLRALFEAEASIGVSIRGTGEMEGEYVANYTLCGCDCVGLPSSSTYTRMTVSESVEAKFVESSEGEQPLNETFNLTTSSTNVVRDLEAAAAIQQQLDSIGYGTVVKTSTKVDEETDPKTGAMTSVTTLEAETSDDVATLDQALSMAKNAMQNGVVSVDSITIENIKEETPKESVETTQPTEEKKLDEDEVEEGIAGAILGGAAGAAIGHPVLGAAAGSLAQDHFNKDESVKMTESKKEPDPKAGRKFVLKCPAGYVAMDGNALVFKEDPKEALHFIVGKEESGLVHLSGVEKILDTMGVYDVEKHYRKEKPTNAEKPVEEGLGGALLGGAAGAMIGHPVLGAAAGSLAQDKFVGDKSNPKQNGWKAGALMGGALGATVGMPLVGAAAGAGLQSMWKNKNEAVEAEPGQTIPSVQEKYDFIVNTVGKDHEFAMKAGRIMKMLANNGISQADASYALANIAEMAQRSTNNGEVANQDMTTYGTNESMEEAGQRFMANVTITKDNGATETDTIPVSATDINAISSEVGNLWDMKSQKASGGVQIVVTDTQTGVNYNYDPAKRTIVQAPVQEAVEQDGKKLSVEFDDGTQVEKEFDDPAQAAVAKAGMEKGKIPGDVMMDEGLMNMFPKKVQKFVRHIRGKDGDDYKPSEDPKYWIIFDNNFRNKELPPIGSFDNKDDAEAFMYGQVKKELWPRASFALVVNRYTESADVNEQLYDKNAPASDEFVEVPMNEEDTQPSVKVTLNNIDWDTEAILNKFRANAQPGDIAIEGDIMSFINELPEEIVVNVDKSELNKMSTKEELEAYLKSKIGEHAGVGILSATVGTIE